MFCPQCGTESSADLKFCRSCGANLKVIGKAVTLSEAIARSDSVPNKIKDLVKSLKIERVTEEVSRAMDKMNQELVQSSTEKAIKIRRRRKERTPEERRERQLIKGLIRLFWGGGLLIFLYFLSHALVLRLPPESIADIPFELDPVVRMAWLIGLIPIFSGIGHVIAALAIRTGARAPEKEVPQIELPEQSPLRIEQPQYDGEATLVGDAYMPPASVTDRTTNILKHKVSPRQTNEFESER